MSFDLHKPSYCPRRSYASHEIMPYDTKKKNAECSKHNRTDGNLSPSINRKHKDDEKSQWSEGRSRLSSEVEGKEERASQYTAEYCYKTGHI